MRTRTRWKRPLDRRTRPRQQTPLARAKRKFRRFFPRGFHDPHYLDWERDYKWETHRRWQAVLGRAEFERALSAGEFTSICAAALRVEQQSRHSMIFSFEKMALRDGVREPEGARRFAEALHALLHGSGSMQDRFTAWVDALANLPRRQTRVLTWPTATVFGFIAQPARHLFIKPMVMRRAAVVCGYPLAYASRPTWETYAQFLDFAGQVRADLAAWKPRDLIDVQSFLWVQGSDEYA